MVRVSVPLTALDLEIVISKVRPLLVAVPIVLVQPVCVAVPPSVKSLVVNELARMASLKVIV
jgi:hypothetical protein